jgi:type II secretory pathway predicted ATPase ExeA
VEHFCWRIENQLDEGGFALVIGAPGSGKSTALRIVADRLGNLGDVRVGVLIRPQASVADFYRELGDLFGVTLTPSNRWGGAKALRQKWIAHIESSLYRPVLLIDEAQAMAPSALNELRLLSSAELDSRSILTVILAGDERLGKKLQTDELLPMASRIRCRLRCGPLEAQTLKECLLNHLQKAGNSRLIAKTVINALCEHAAGNYRVLMNMANDLLAAALQQEAAEIDEKLFFEVFDIQAATSRRSNS